MGELLSLIKRERVVCCLLKGDLRDRKKSIRGDFILLILQKESVRRAQAYRGTLGLDL